MPTILVIYLLYTYNGENLICQHAGSKEQAIVNCATECFDFYTGRIKMRGKKVTEREGLDIIDVCANPKEKK